MSPEPVDVTTLLLQWGEGDQRALEQLTPIVYNDLRKVARTLLSRERPDHTLSATALVHEAYLRLIDQRRVSWENRVHFFGAAAHIMRRVLVDHARARASAKRGGSSLKIAIGEEDVAGEVGSFAEEIIDLDRSLEKLAEIDPRKARIVELKYFAGLTNDETAAALEISGATVERDWRLARAWLIKAMHSA